mmetsp:Transcript_30585/g.64102  ORF Transcript_30585/g.64102 Transcript_30585/m.64102 type:complete len:82 (-) Transcript_30585:15-260(-)
MLNQIFKEVGLSANDQRNFYQETIADERASSRFPPSTPRFVVLDLMVVTHLDASSTRGCFLHLAKMAGKNHCFCLRFEPRD